MNRHSICDAILAKIHSSTLLFLQSCRLGDFVLKDHPGDYEEAITVYKAPPDMLGEDHQYAVPVKVWLYPIDKLPLSISAIKVRELGQSILIEVTKTLEEMENFVS